MPEDAARPPGSTPPEPGARLDHAESLKSLEYAIQALTENAEFAREMAARARTSGDVESAAEYDHEALTADGHTAQLSRLAGTLRVLSQVTRPRRSRAA